MIKSACRKIFRSSRGWFCCRCLWDSRFLRTRGNTWLAAHSTQKKRDDCALFWKWIKKQPYLWFWNNVFEKNCAALPPEWYLCSRKNSPWQRSNCNSSLTGIRVLQGRGLDRATTLKLLIRRISSELGGAHAWGRICAPLSLPKMDYQFFEFPFFPPWCAQSLHSAFRKLLFRAGAAHESRPPGSSAASRSCGRAASELRINDSESFILESKTSFRGQLLDQRLQFLLYHNKVKRTKSEKSRLKISSAKFGTFPAQKFWSSSFYAQKNPQLLRIPNTPRKKNKITKKTTARVAHTSYNTRSRLTRGRFSKTQILR